jgi:hypothetical protein
VKIVLDGFIDSIGIGRCTLELPKCRDVVADEENDDRQKERWKGGERGLATEFEGIDVIGEDERDQAEDGAHDQSDPLRAAESWLWHVDNS